MSFLLKFKGKAVLGLREVHARKVQEDDVANPIPDQGGSCSEPLLAFIHPLPAIAEWRATTVLRK